MHLQKTHFTDTEKIETINDKIEGIHLEGASHFIRYIRIDGSVPARQTFLGNIYQ